MGCQIRLGQWRLVVFGLDLEVRVVDLENLRSRIRDNGYQFIYPLLRYWI